MVRLLSSTEGVALCHWLSGWLVGWLVGRCALSTDPAEPLSLERTLTLLLRLVRLLETDWGRTVSVSVSVSVAESARESRLCR